jgi:hypothetical protein
LKGATSSNVNSDISNHDLNAINNNNNNNNVNSEHNSNLVSYEHLSETASWIELVLPLTILAITLIAVIFIGIILFIWIQKYFREKREKTNFIKSCDQQILDSKINIQSKNYCTKKRCEKINNNNNRSNKMNSRKWLKGKSSTASSSSAFNKHHQQQSIGNQIVSDLEQKLETIEFKSTPPTSPNTQKINDDGDDDDDDSNVSEKLSEVQSNSEKEKEACSAGSGGTTATAIIPCPMAICDISFASVIQPTSSTSTSNTPSDLIMPTQNMTSSTSSSLSLLQEEVHCVQPREELSSKIYKSIATSPPPFSPVGAHHHQHQPSYHQKFVTTGTQTYFTKSPNSPNNLLNSSFTVLQTPTSSTCNTNPFLVSPSDNNKENKEPSSKLRNVCLNKTISNFKQENCSGQQQQVDKYGTGSSSASSPSSVISTSPKLVATSPKFNINVLQQQNSPSIISSDSSPLFNRQFSFSPKFANAHINTGSPPISASTQKAGNYFRFPEIETPPAIMVAAAAAAIAELTSLSNSSPSTPKVCTQSVDEIAATTKMDVPIIKRFENLCLDTSSSNSSDNNNSSSICGKDREIILKIDEVESPVVEDKMSDEDCSNRDKNVTNNNNNNNNYNNNFNNYNNNNSSENTLTIRRARLKSISLDSDGARLVEENLTMPVEELVEIASYNNKQINDSESESGMTSSSAIAASCANNNNININDNNNRFNPKNIYNLTINLDFHDSSLDMTESSGDINMNQDNQDYDEMEMDDGLCRTPTMKYFRQKKAVSLDSDNNQDGGAGGSQHHQHHHHQHHHSSSSSSNSKMMQQQFAGKMASSETFNYYFGQSASKMNSSISVPSTPKHLSSTNKLKISSSEDRGGSASHCGSRYNRKLGSFEENVDSTNNKLHVTTHVQQSSYKTNLTASIQTLNISSSNLKTLPEIMSINDFDGNQSALKSSLSSRIIGPPPSTSSSAILPSKSGILQRRGSNHSLTLNLDGSCGNLARGLSCSNYSLGNLHSSHLNIAGSNYNLQSGIGSGVMCGSGQQSHRIMAVKKNLLQRRGSNTSLSLNIQGSNNNLNRFNSHSSLNITGEKSQKKNLLERRNSNASLTLNIQNRGLSISNCNLRGSECSLSSVNTNQMAEMMMLEQEAEHQENENESNVNEKYSRHERKFLSSENLNSIRMTNMSACSSHRQQSQHQTPYGSIDNLKQTQPYHEKIPVISTKPLSPQSTSEDFKIYLANIQFLQSASNVLDEEHLKTLNGLFQKSYKNQHKTDGSLAQQLRQFNNDDILNSKISTGTDGSLVSFGTSTSSPDEDQKQLLIKLHQEFWNLPTNYQEKPMVFGSQSKNRYKTILPNEHSRVILQREEGALVEPYINANFIKVK